MQRVLSVYWPSFSTDLAARRARGSGAWADPGPCPVCLLVSCVAAREVVAACSPRARAAGAAPGMPLSEARALIRDPSVWIEPHRPDRESRSLEAMARWSLRFSPRVAVDPPDGILIDITGCERLYHGEPRLIGLVADAFESLRFQTRAAIASTIGCAWAMSRFGSQPRLVIAAGEERGAVAALPIAAIRPDPAAQEALGRVGVSRVEHLLRLPRAELAERFGPGLIQRLDQALGTAIEVIEPIRCPTPIDEEIRFEGATTQYEAVESACRELVHRVAKKLEAVGKGATKLQLTLHGEHARRTELSITLTCPSRDPRHLELLFRHKLERLSLEFAVEVVSLSATGLGRMPGQQLVIGNREQGTGNREEGELIDRLLARLGPEAVLEADAVESHLPERAFRLRSIQQVGSSNPVSFTRHDRPTVLLARPEPAEVMLLTPEGPVLSLLWRGRSHKVLVSRGPERLSCEWWRQKEVYPDRDYFILHEESGHCGWVYREVATGRWFVHGEWA